MVRRRRIAVLAVATFFACATGIAACASQQVESSDSPTSKQTKGSAETDGEAGWNGHKRLASSVVPKRYELDLMIDPSTSTFRGDVAIDVSVEKPVERIRMHAENMEFSVVEASRDGEAVDVEANAVENGGLILTLGETLEPGALRLHFRYEAPLDDVPEGLYRVKDKGGWYAYTQFEPLEAREAFPCFDEPRFKTPFETSVTVPKSMMAATNGPKTGEETYEPSDAGPDFGELEDVSKLQTWEFAETKPLPTYLVAFAVGDFDVVESSEVLSEEEQLEGVPVRVLTTKGNGELARYALKYTPPLVRFQKRYFDSEFPYQKMDLVAVPNFSAGAMENVGLVTYRESILLLDEAQASAHDEYVAQAVMAHEYAHMWFGNSVTLAWWDDLWLNEAFATWMGGRTVQEVSPELESELESLENRSGVIEADSLKKSRAIRQPIEHAGDVYNAFDRITYKKGAAILRMFEAWIGEETFRKGVRAYLGNHAHGVAETTDLLRALGEASGKPVSEVIAAFLDQPGAPLVTLTYDRKKCEKRGEATIALEQDRYLPVGSEAEAGNPWKIPMCVRYSTGNETKRTCFLFEGTDESPRRQKVTLETETCPTWVHPNAAEKGYYHWKVRPESQQKRLLEAQESLTLPERVALLGHLKALVRSGELPAAEYLQALEAMSAAEHRLIVEHIVDTLYEFEEVVFRSEPTEAFRRFVEKLVRPHYERIGFEPSKGESVGAKLSRSRLVKAMANLVGDPDVRQRARKAAVSFIESSDSVPAPVAKFAMDIAAKQGDAALWKSFRKQVSEASTPDLRASYIGALGHFEEPKLAKKTLALFKTEAVRAQNFWRLVGPISGDPKTADIAWSWMTENYDAIVDKIGESHAGSLPWVGSAYCTKAGKKKVASFFSQEAHQTIGTERNLAQTLQSIEQCIAFRKAIEPSVRSYLEQ